MTNPGSPLAVSAFGYGDPVGELNAHPAVARPRRASPGRRSSGIQITRTGRSSSPPADGVGARAGPMETIVTKRNTAQQRARELQQAEGIGYHEALSRVQEGARLKQQNVPSVTLTESTLIVIESAHGLRCNGCYTFMDWGQWALYLHDVSTYGNGTFALCAACAAAIGKAVDRIPAGPAPDTEDPDVWPPFPEGTETERIVAYRRLDRVHLLCRRHKPDPLGDEYEPVTSEDLERGGFCTVCRTDVLID